MYQGQKLVSVELDGRQVHPEKLARAILAGASPNRIPARFEDPVLGEFDTFVFWSYRQLGQPNAVQFFFKASSGTVLWSLTMLKPGV